MPPMPNVRHPPNPHPSSNEEHYRDDTGRICCLAHKVPLKRYMSRTDTHPNMWFYKCPGLCRIFQWENMLQYIPAQANGSSNMVQRTLPEVVQMTPPTSPSKRPRTDDNGPETPTAKRSHLDTPSSRLRLTPAQSARRDQKIAEGLKERERLAGSSAQVQQQPISSVQQELNQAARRPSESDDEYDQHFDGIDYSTVVLDPNTIAPDRATTPTRSYNNDQLMTPPGSSSSSSGSKGKEREQPAGRWPTIQSDPDNPFEVENSPEPQDRQPRDPVFTVAYADSTELCRAIGMAALHTDELKEIIKDLKKENKIVKKENRRLKAENNELKARGRN